MRTQGEKMVRILADLYGRNSTQAVGVSVHNQLVDSISEIAASQVLGYDGRPLSWLDYNMTAGKALRANIARLTSDRTLKRFWDGNPEYRETLLLLGNELCEECDARQFDPNSKTSLSHRIEALSVSAFENDRAMLLSLWDDSWVDDKRKVDEQPQVWVARTHLMLPLPHPAAYKLGLQEAALTSDLRLLYGRDLTGAPGPAIMGVSLAGAGGESTLSSGESLDHKGYMLSLSALYMKKAWGYRAVRHIFGEGNVKDLFEATFSINTTHERAHEADNDKIGRFRAERNEIEVRIKNGIASKEDILRLGFLTGFLSKTRVTDEISVDLPAVINTFENLDKNRNTMNELDYQRAVRNVVLATIIEYVTEGLMTSSNSGEIFSGYRISGINIINKMVEFGIIIYDARKSTWGINTNPSSINGFLATLRNMSRGLSENDPNVIGAIKNESQLPETRKLGELFADFKSYYQRIGLA